MRTRGAIAAAFSAVIGAASPMGTSAALRAALPQAPRTSTGTISGRVVDPGGMAISGLCIDASTVSAGPSTTPATTTSAGDGTYTLTVPAGNYAVGFGTDLACYRVGTQGFDPAYWHGMPTLLSATTVAVAPGGAVTGIDATLHRPAVVSGTIRAGGAPLAGACINAYGPSASGGAVTGAGGGYSMTLTTGYYQIRMRPCQTPPAYLDVAYHPPGASPYLLVRDDTTVSGIDAVLPPSATVTGHVTAGGAPLLDMCVRLTDAAGNSVIEGSASTGQDGSYTMTGIAPGTYALSAGPCSPSPPYARRWYGDSPDLSHATPVTLIGGHTTAGIDVALRVGASIAGTVTGTSGYTCVSVFAGRLAGANQSPLQYALSNGHYSIGGLSPGSYTVQFNVSVAGCYATAGGLLGQHYNGRAVGSYGDLVTVGDGQARSGIDAHLVAGGVISGHVRDGANGPLAGICVTATDADNPPSPDNQIIHSATSASDGSYAITALDTSEYTVAFAPCTGTAFAPRWYKARSVASGADLVPVHAGSTTAAIDAQLSPGGSITGTVTDGGALPLAAGLVCVQATSTSGGPGGSATVDSTTGAYSVGGLPAGSYTVAFTNCNSVSQYSAQQYNGKSPTGPGDPVTVAAGQTTSGVNAAMLHAGAITGRVVDASGRALQGICVQEGPGSGEQRQVYTDAGGAYELTSENVGVYTVRFGCAPGPGQNPPNPWTTQWYQGAATPATATPVNVGSGQLAAGIDATLAPAASISGTVTDTQGHPLGGICVSSGPHGSPWSGASPATTGPRGGYLIQGLAAGSYDVHFTDCLHPQSAAWGPQWYHLATTRAGATAVVLSSGQAATGVDAHLGGGGAVSGFVTGPGGAPVGGACVDVYEGRLHALLASTVAASRGGYRVGGLGAGSVTVEARPCATGQSALAPAWSPSSPNQKGAGLVSVSLGATATANVSLVAGGQVSGVVADTAGFTAGGVPVVLEPLDGQDLPNPMTTLGDGTFDVAGLAAGRYLLEMASAGLQNGPWTDRWYAGVDTPLGATVLTVGAGGSIGPLTVGVVRGSAPVGQVTAVTPAQAAPGTTVTITGYHLTGTTAVYFGAMRAATVSVVDDQHVTATLPPTAGEYYAVVQSAAGSSPVTPFGRVDVA